MKQTMKYFLSRQMVRRKKSRAHTVEELERRHIKPSLPGFNDSIYFAGWQPGGLSFVTRQAFRSGKPHENWLKIHVPEEGVWGFENISFPAGEGFRQGPLEYVCKEPGKRWHLKYNGPVRQDGKEEHAVLDIIWEGKGKIIDFDHTGALPEATALEIARQPWNRDFFRKLKELHKVHYEQAGEVRGTLTFKGKKHALAGGGVRDHSFGIRHWEGWHRHIWFLGILEDGRYFNASVIDYDFIKNLKAGYLGKGDAVRTLAGVPSFEQLAWEPSLPKILDLYVQEKNGGEKKHLAAKMKIFFPFTMDGVYHIRQSLADFTYDGTPGTGIAEMGINMKKYEPHITG